MTRNNMTNVEEDHFNASLLTLLNDQQDLTKTITLLLTLLNDQQDLTKTITQYDARHDIDMNMTI